MWRARQRRFSVHLAQSAELVQSLAHVMNVAQRCPSEGIVYVYYIALRASEWRTSAGPRSVGGESAIVYYVSHINSRPAPESLERYSIDSCQFTITQLQRVFVRMFAPFASRALFRPLVCHSAARYAQ